MLVDYNPDDYKTVTTQHTCGFHKINPGKSWAGCTCSGSYGLVKKTTEELEGDKRLAAWAKGGLRMSKVGDRVVAIRDSNPETRILNIYGVGVYGGDEEPPAGLEGLFFGGMPNPKIELDGGGVVWGAQCWWGAESQLEDYREHGYKVVTVPLREVVEEDQDV